MAKERKDGTWKTSGYHLQMWNKLVFEETFEGFESGHANHGNRRSWCKVWPWPLRTIKETKLPRRVEHVETFQLRAQKPSYRVSKSVQITGKTHELNPWTWLYDQPPLSKSFNSLRQILPFHIGPSNLFQRNLGRDKFIERNVSYIM